MRHFPVALVFCALPAAVFPQEVSCQACEHAAPYFRGEGGFIGTLAEGVDRVTFVASCGNVTITGEVEAEGTVAQLFTYRNGLACEQEGGSLEIAGLQDGGWYWITDDRNSAVGALVSKDALSNEPTSIVSAGAGVSMTMGNGAVFLKETATGRVGILPTILPEPPLPDAVLCGPRRNPDWPYPYDRQMTSGCMLGDGKTKIRLIGPGRYNSRSVITTGMVTRPAAGTIEVSADLWLNESGSYSTDTNGADGTPTDESMRKGWVDTTASGQADHRANWLTATFSVALASSDPQTGDIAGAGVTLTGDGTGSTPAGQATITIGADDDYCPAEGAQHTATINIRADPGDNAVHPAVATGRGAGFTAPDLATIAAATQLRIVCAPQ